MTNKAFKINMTMIIRDSSIIKERNQKDSLYIKNNIFSVN